MKTGMTMDAVGKWMNRLDGHEENGFSDCTTCRKEMRDGL